MTWSSRSRPWEWRSSIGKALGIIMALLDIDDQRAFAYLSRCSQADNRKVYELAKEVVATRELPPLTSRNLTGAPTLADRRRRGPEEGQGAEELVGHRPGVQCPSTSALSRRASMRICPPRLRRVTSPT